MDSDGGASDIPDLWPAVTWIAIGIHLFAGMPESFSWWKGALFFLGGAPVMLLVTGTATARMRRMVTEMVDDVFPRRDRFAEAVSMMLRLMLLLVEALLVFYAALGTMTLLR